MKVCRTAVLDPDQVAAVLQPRDGVIAESAVGEGEFCLLEGPVRSYHRGIDVEPAGSLLRVTQTVEFEVGIPYFSALFALPLRWALGPVMPPAMAPWWAPPQRLPRRAAEVLATLCALSVVIGYAGSLLTITMTYAAAEFGADRAAQGVAFGVVRTNVALALLVLVAADRQGRRRLILACAAGAAGLTTLGAIAPSLPWLVATQIPAVALTAALLILVGVMAAEEMPAGSRAWALAVMTMTVGLGGGLATAVLPLAGVTTGGWRLTFAGAVVFLPLVASARGHLPESRRWDAAKRAATDPAPATDAPDPAPATHPAPATDRQAPSTTRRRLDPQAPST
ncbi:MAG: MFS transporter, partial [Acidimicrobiales bacterium]